MMDFKKAVEETFYSLIVEYKLFVELVDEKYIKLTGNTFIIKVQHHMHEVFVIISKEGTEIDIRPTLWACFRNKYDYKETLPLHYPNGMVLREILVYNLFQEATFIRFFCKELLDGDFSKAEEYKKKSPDILIEMNNYYRKKMKTE